jgi:hypothetical protein
MFKSFLSLRSLRSSSLRRTVECLKIFEFVTSPKISIFSDAWNEEADRLAASAHGDPSVTTWTTQMSPLHETPFWIVHDGRVIPKRPRRLLREQGEAIISEQLVKQINAVHGLPDQTPEDVMRTLKPLLWVTFPGGRIQKNCWNITNYHDTRF